MRNQLILFLLFAAGGPGLAAEEPLPEKISFNRHIRPILSENCFQCHGQDKAQRQAELRLDVAEGAVTDLGGHQAVLPGKPLESALYQRIRETDPDLVMPPPETEKTLTARQQELIRRWIEQGGRYEAHWAFVPPQRPELPAVSRPEWVRNPLDRFVLARLDQEQLVPAKPANRVTLIRRVTLDLTGLPPTPAEVDEFLKDKSPDAYEKVVDRLLKSPRYGEHLASQWLDVSRYADTNGYQYDLEREQWAWRDWVIHAFNENMPFDRFTIEQLAGDLLPNATPQQQLATAFNRNHAITIEGGVIDEEYRTEYVVDRVVTTSTAWLGMTFLCARCHDHKYDPLTQQDFYRFFAYFNQVPERGLNGFDPKIRVVSPLQQDQLSAVETELAAAENGLREVMRKSGLTPEKLEAELQRRLQSEWKVVTPAKAVSANGAALKVLDDQSVLSSGNNPATDAYEILLENVDGVDALRLEVFTDPSLPTASVGRASNGNFVLSELEAEWAPASAPEQFKPVKFTEATADYSQTDYPVTAAIDGQGGRGGWAVDGNSRRENSTAYFHTSSIGLGPGGGRLRIRMKHEWGGSHAIGRFRWSVYYGGRKPLSHQQRRIAGIPREKRSAAQNAEVDAHIMAWLAPRDAWPAMQRAAELRQRREQLQSQIPETMVMRELPSPRATHVLYRGEYNQPREVVEAGTPAALPALPAEFPHNRLGLAKWLVMPGQPLTARVTVNRFWQRLFGTGLVKTTEDFGAQGEWPSHPELLDWLAVEFQESGWDVKRLHKLIVLSATYQQSSQVTPAQLERDPDNRLLARASRFRLEAEAIRDSALAVSGLLSDHIGGPSVFPYHPKGLWEEINNRPGYSRVYQQDSGDKLYRRSLYTFWKRTVPPPALATFDAPEREFCVVRRSRTNTPLQALVLLHSPQYVEAARFLGRRMLAAGEMPEEQIQAGVRLCLSRPATAEELAIFRDLYAERLKYYEQHPDAAAQLLSVGDADDTDNRTAPLAAATTVARLLLNLSEFITRE